MNQMIPLAKLRLSPINVRTVSDEKLNIPSMAADIAARGVLQNLLATPVKKPRGSFEVFDGGRRLRALNLLAEQGTIDPATFEVPVLVVKAEDAELSETSLAANFHQLKLTPAEECRAFQHFLGVDGDIDAVAKRFGQTRRFIEGRLRLAGLADPVFEALAKGDMTLDMAKAYASTDDHAKQVRIFEQYGHYSYTTPDQIRRAIAGDALKATDPIAILVGEDAYVAAGGSVERELFSEDGDRWADPEIARELAGKLMEAEAQRLGEETGLAWIRPIASSHIYNATADLHRVSLPTVPFTDEEQQRIDAIAERMDEIAGQIDNGQVEDDDAASALEDEYRTLDAEYDELSDRPTILPDDLKTQVGTFLILAPDGSMKLETSYFSETPIRTSDDDQGPVGGATRSGGIQSPPEATAPGGKPLSARLSDELAMQRRDILSAAILANPALALDYALFAMIDGNRGYDRYGTTMKASRPQDPALGGELEPTQARIAIEQAREALDASWTEAGDVVARFEAFRSLDDEAKAAWLALMVAGSLEAKPEYSATTNPLHARLASILEIDVAQWWRPTSANFFDRVAKGTLLALLTDIGGTTLASRYSASKKGDVSSACEKLFAGEAITETDTKEAALAWVPDAMRFDVERPVLDEPLDDEDEDGTTSDPGGDVDLEEDPAGDCGDQLDESDVEQPDEALEPAE
ncbi:ParB/RepB/Spo0J family partition protein [Croceicoccus marinus]|uniref:ParB N-terminal domain-containing protein n=1 Tax=Croceicoccus marinus TaxID=450378 RepID=A0A7G6W1C6_9SPHN|nr:ParB/RepB/Spo0J family partition protein [Croceicoccus marinus]QNE07791.1 ParB N-terminal domain-containing protein [Croceicoccus marinus]